MEGACNWIFRSAVGNVYGDDVHADVQRQFTQPYIRLAASMLPLSPSYGSEQ